MCKTGVTDAESVYDCIILSIWGKIWPAEDCVFYSSKFSILIKPVRLSFEEYALFLELVF